VTKKRIGHRKKEGREDNKGKMTHVNNGEKEKEMEVEVEPVRERERERETAAGSGVQHRFLASASERDGNRDYALEAAAASTSSSAAAAAAPTTTTTTITTNLEDLAFEACQNWSELHQDFFITDDELEYDDELLSLGSSSSIGNICHIATAAATAAEGLITGEQQNEQLLMEGA